jgi:hypothetical protein
MPLFLLTGQSHLEQIDSEGVNKLTRITYDPRHCESRRPVAIQAAFLFASAFQVAEPMHGLPRRAARAMTNAMRYAPSFINVR